MTFGPRRYGRVMYVHGDGIDYPIAVVRSAYSEALASAGWMYPFANHKGQFDRGYGQGTCSVVEGRRPYLTEPIGEQPTSSDPVTGQRSDEGPMTVCMEIDWPGRMSFSSGYRRPMWGTVSPWMGSLVYHGRDLSGQMYRRNRFYDPKTARFTQEDPIGIAGGLNVYGYVGGDPVNFHDPFGLCAQAAGDTLPKVEVCEEKADLPGYVFKYSAQVVACGRYGARTWTRGWWAAGGRRVRVQGQHPLRNEDRNC